MSWPEQPVLYEVNTAVWLDAVSRDAGRPVTLADAPRGAWDAVTPDGVDAVWLMGVWERSPVGLAAARSNATLMASFRDALPDLRDDDVVGSPYCVHRYEVDTAFGGRTGLEVARQELARRGKRLVLDYVPNHVAPDHPWVTAHPERFIRGTSADLRRDEQTWLVVGDEVLAHGRDPYFPPWPDVVQLNAFAPETRRATSDTLSGIASLCDGIRCDMAMLMTNNIFGKTWAPWCGPEPADEFWPTVITAMRRDHPQTLLFAEAYWELEWELQQQGFNFCYDKRLYDRLLEGNVGGVRDHLRADLAYQRRLVRFLENHDEPRVASRLPETRVKACTVAMATLPGATLWHDGQFEGRRVRPPVFLRRRPAEPTDPDLAMWHKQLVALIDEEQLREGAWQQLDVAGWPDNDTCRNLVAWAWHDSGPHHRHVIVVNLSDAPAQARIRLPWSDLAGRSCRMVDLLQAQDFRRDGDELTSSGLYVALDGWQFHVLAIDG